MIMLVQCMLGALFFIFIPTIKKCFPIRTLKTKARCYEVSMTTGELSKIKTWLNV